MIIAYKADLADRRSIFPWFTSAVQRTVLHILSTPAYNGLCLHILMISRLPHGGRSIEGCTAEGGVRACFAFSINRIPAAAQTGIILQHCRCRRSHCCGGSVGELHKGRHGARQRFRHEIGGVKALQLRSNLHRKIGSVKPGDPSDAAFAGDQSVPVGFDAKAHRRDGSHSRDNQSIRVQACPSIICNLRSFHPAKADAPAPFAGAKKPARCRFPPQSGRPVPAQKSSAVILPEKSENGKKQPRNSLWKVCKDRFYILCKQRIFSPPDPAVCRMPSPARDPGPACRNPGGYRWHAAVFQYFQYSKNTDVRQYSPHFFTYLYRQPPRQAGAFRRNVAQATFFVPKNSLY